MVPPPFLFVFPGLYLYISPNDDFPPTIPLLPALAILSFLLHLLIADSRYPICIRLLFFSHRSDDDF